VDSNNAAKPKKESNVIDAAVAT